MGTGSISALTPGPELFPAGRRTCTLSHARHPLLTDIDYNIPEKKLVEKEKEILGFVLVEHQLSTGVLFLAVTMPWAVAGDAFNATTILLDETIRQVRADVHAINTVRLQQGLDAYPEPCCIWGITPFAKNSHMMQALDRRGPTFLEDFVEEHPSTDLNLFPPLQEIHIPTEFVKALQIFIRKITPEDGVGAPPSSVGGKVSHSKLLKAKKGKAPMR
ncbi:hypothetical protein JCM11641_005980 [Rhodosporidiobolus odoratus]